MTKEQVNQKYRGKYIDIGQSYDYQNDCWDYEIRKVFSTIHENTTLGEDVGTDMEYCR